MIAMQDGKHKNEKARMTGPLSRNGMLREKEFGTAIGLAVWLSPR
jgi:hypothetical protein